MKPLNVNFVLGLEVHFMSGSSACFCMFWMREGEKLGVKRASFNFSPWLKYVVLP